MTKLISVRIENNQEVKMKKFLITSIFFLFVITCFSCGNDRVTAREIYEQFRDHYENQDYEAMVDMLSNSCKERLDKISSDSIADTLKAKIEEDKATLFQALNFPIGEIERILENRMFEKEGSGSIGFLFKTNTGRYEWKISKNRDTNKWLISL